MLKLSNFAAVKEDVRAIEQLSGAQWIVAQYVPKSNLLFAWSTGALLGLCAGITARESLAEHGCNEEPPMVVYYASNT